MGKNKYYGMMEMRNIHYYLKELLANQLITLKPAIHENRAIE